MEPTDALHSIETALRLLIMEVLGDDSWLAAPGAPDLSRLEEKQSEEFKRRDGIAVVSSRLIDYAETYQLTGLIAKNWESFKPAFADKSRTMAYFSIVEDVRNNIAHNRDLAPFERDLISGIAGQLRSQVSIYRSERSAVARYYPLIETVNDNFGNQGPAHRSKRYSSDKPLMRLEVGDVLTFEGSAFDARGKGCRWLVATGNRGWHHVSRTDVADIAEGDRVAFQYKVTEANVGEEFKVLVKIASKSKYHRYVLPGGESYDDSTEFTYAVNPPYDE